MLLIGLSASLRRKPHAGFGVFKAFFGVAGHVVVTVGVTHLTLQFETLLATQQPVYGYPGNAQGLIFRALQLHPCPLKDWQIRRERPHRHMLALAVRGHFNLVSAVFFPD